MDIILLIVILASVALLFFICYFAKIKDFCQEQFTNSLLKDKNLIICGMVRDSAKNVIKNLNALEQISEKFGKSEFILIENDSKDGTDKLVKNWGNKRSNVTVISEKMDRKLKNKLPPGPELKSDYPLSKKRFVKMALIRNRYMEELKKSKLSNLNNTWVMIVDLDLDKIPIDATIESLRNLPSTWEVICANGITSACNRENYGTPACMFKRKDNGKLGRSYDSLATRYDDDDLNSNFLISKKENSKKIRERWEAHEAKSWANTNSPDQGPIDVKSCFGGLALYKAKDFKNLKYNGEDCEHISINKQFNDVKIIPDFNVYYD